MKTSGSALRILATSLCLCGTLAGQARAGDNNWYAGVALGQSKADLPSAAAWDAVLATGGVTSTSTLDDKDTALGLFVGRSFSRNLAVELSYADFGETGYTSNITVPALGTLKVPFEGTSWGVSLVGSLPLNERFSLQAKLGYQFWDAKASVTVGGTTIDAGSDDGSDLMYGLGVKYDINDKFAVRAFWDRYKFDDTDVDFYGIGVQVGF